MVGGIGTAVGTESNSLFVGLGDGFLVGFLVGLCVGFLVGSYDGLCVGY